MYYINAYHISKSIESAWMDGVGHSVLTAESLVDPMGLAIDHHMNDRLFWTDHKRGTIESMNHDGTDRIVVQITGQLLIHNNVYSENICYFYYFRTAETLECKRCLVERKVNPRKSISHVWYYKAPKFEPLPANHDNSRFKSVLLISRLTIVIWNEITV